MIYTVTLNPCIDWHAAGPVTPGTVHRFAEGFLAPGGKGVNVSLLLRDLGVENIALGFAAGFTGREIVRLLEEAGCTAEFIFLRQGFSRINLNITEPSGSETAFNGAGPAVAPDEAERLLDRVSALVPGDQLVLAGSVPPSLPRDIYARLLDRVPAGVNTVVDTAGAPLRAAVQRHPFLVKPNLQELEELFQAQITGLEGVCQCAQALQEEGARNIIVSMGARGALLLTEEGKRFFCRAPRGAAVSTVGAGDSLVAGFLYGSRLHGTLEGGLRWGVAAGAATAFTRGIAGKEQVFAALRETGNVHPV